MAKLLDAIRSAVESSGKTRYQIAKESGISAGQLSRLINRQRGMTLETVERLATYLGLEIKVVRGSSAKKEK